MKIHQNWGIYRSSTGISFVAFFNHIVWGWQVMTSSPRCWLVDCQSWFRRQALSAMWCSPLVGGPMGSFFLSFSPPEIHRNPTRNGRFLGGKSTGNPGVVLKSECQEEEAAPETTPEVGAGFIRSPGQILYLPWCDTADTRTSCWGSLASYQVRGWETLNEFVHSCKVVSIDVCWFLFTHPTRLYHKPKRQAIVIPMFKPT